MSSAERAALLQAITQLKRCVGALRSHYGESPGVRRLVNDVERLDIDAADLADYPQTPEPRPGTPTRSDVVVVPDTPYDPALWRDADEEGVGGLRHPQQPS